MSKPALSVIVPNLDGGEMLVDCLRSATQQTAELELILVDNGSKDESPERVEEIFPESRIIRNDRNLGFAPACNQGARLSRAPFLLFLNTDAFVPPGGLDRLMNVAIDDEQGGAWQPVTVHENGSLDSAGDQFTRWGFLWHLREPAAGHLAHISVFSVKGACLLCRKEAFDAVGGFEDSFFAYYEETDLCWRLRLMGWEVRIVPSVRVVHLSGRTARRILAPHELRFLSFRNRVRAIIRNSSFRSMMLILPRHYLGSLATAAALLARGRPRSAVAVLAALGWPLTHTSQMGEERRRVQRLRRVTDKDVFKPELVVRLSPHRAWRLLRAHISRWERS